MPVVTPAPGLNPNVNQIYPIINSVFRQMTGRDDLTAVDTASMVAMGNELENLGKYDLWLNSLSRRIGGTIDSFRPYTSKYSDLYRTQMEWGAAMQKITVEMPEITEDKIYDVGKMDGQSVDQYIISNPKVSQKIFENESPWGVFVTIQHKLLREAFLNEGAMQRLISMIFGQILNKHEFVIEELGRLCVANMALNIGAGQEFHLVSIYNSLRGASLNTGTAMFDEDFLRWTTGIINALSDKLEVMSVLYNAEGKTRFTPKKMQRLYMLADFMTALRTRIYYNAYNKEEIMTHPNILVPYWQALKSLKDANNFATISSIDGTTNGAKNAHVEKKVSNLIGLLFDRDAAGSFRQEETVLTTPVNARAAYYNTFWHENQLWFNDMQENALAFYLD